jgi:hypothetical protein
MFGFGLKKLSDLNTFYTRHEAKKVRNLNMLVDAIAHKLPADKYPLRLHSTRELEYINNNPDSIFNLARQCDWYITKKGIFKIVDTNEPKVIFLDTFTYKNLVNFTINILPYLKHKFVLVIAGNDYMTPSGQFETNVKYYDIPEWQSVKMKLIDHPNIIRIFVENLDMVHPKLEPIPLGMCFAKFDTYYHDILNGVKDIDYDKKDIEVLCQHNIHWKENANPKSWFYGYATERIAFNELAKKAPLNKLVHLVQHDIKDTMWGVKVEDFKANVLRSSFLICIHGGGLDPCPKVWEAILLGCIPIIKKSTVSDAFKCLPVVIVDEMDEKTITLENLDKWYDEFIPYYKDKEKRKEVLYKLSQKYWIDYIRSFSE